MSKKATISNIHNISTPSNMQENSLRFLHSEVSPRPPEECLFHVIPVPYEATVSYGEGTKNGPDAILNASDQLELFNGKTCPGEQGIFTHKPIDCHNATPETILTRIYDCAKSVLNIHKIPVLLGGEHSITYGALKACKEHYGNIGVVQFDAHADLRNEYGGSKWSHASAMRRAVDDLALPLVQFGNRAFCLEEHQARKTYNVRSFDAEFLAHNPLPIDAIPDNFPEHIFITFDVDGLDPSIIPDTGTPVAGGLQWYQALDLAKFSLQNRKLIGFDVVELAPREGSIVSDFASAQLTYALMALV